MDGRVTKGIIAISITALVGGSYRLISYYKGNTIPNLLVPTSFDVSAKDIAESKLTNLSEAEEQGLLDGSAVTPPSKPSTEQKRQNPAQEAVDPAKEGSGPSNSVSVLAQSKTTQSPPPASKDLKVLGQGIEIDDQISVELPCIGKLWNKGNLSNNYLETLFKWKFPLSAEDKENLSKNKTFSGPAILTVARKDNNEKLWDSSENDSKKVKGAQVRWNTTGTIAIVLNSWVEGVKDAKNMQQIGSFQKTFLYCQNNGLGLGRGEILYKYGKLEMDESKIAEATERPMTMNVSLVKCVNQGKDKKQGCNLKVVTGNRLDWSKKIKNKVTLVTGEK